MTNIRDNQGASAGAGHSTYRIRKFERRAVTVLLKARALASDINAEFGLESTVSDFADNVVHQAEDLAGALEKLPTRLKNGGRP